MVDNICLYMWGAGPVRAPRALLLLAYETSLRMSVAVTGYPQVVCLVCVQACLPRGSSYSAFCIRYVAESAWGRCVYTCVSVSSLLWLSGARRSCCVYLRAMDCSHVVVLHPV